MDDRQILAEDYEDCFSSFKLTRRISSRQIKRALERILANGRVTVSGNEVTLKQKDGIRRYQYYVTQNTDRSRYPWYQISKERLEHLKKENISGIICIFFDEAEGAGYPVFYRIWNPEEVEGDPWKESRSRDGKESYRWNPEKRYKQEMTETEGKVQV